MEQDILEFVRSSTDENHKWISLSNYEISTCYQLNHNRFESAIINLVKAEAIAVYIDNGEIYMRLMQQGADYLEEMDAIEEAIKRSKNVNTSST